jgi:4-hydroxy-3-polyprenylbenzoate decarboxylase
MGYSIRDYIALLESRGELIQVNEEVDWRYELYGFASMCGRVSGPAMLFNKIKGMPEGGGRVLCGHYVGNIRRPHRRVCLAIGADPDIELFEAIGQVLGKMGSPLKPVEVASGPVKEVIKMGKDVNLFDFPFVVNSPIDGGRYQLTNALIIKDPDSDWTNWGNYACMIASKNRLVVTPGPGGDFSTIFNKYKSRGQRMPFAWCVGGDPASSLVAGAALPPGVSESEVAGGLRGAPMELVRAETSDLLVPADAEIVAEGEFRPDEVIMEGPKPEWYAFASGPRAPGYGMKVNCITYRKNPILPITAHISNSITDLSGQLYTMFAAGITAYCMMVGIPVKVGMLTGPEVGAGYSFYLSTKDLYPGFARDAIEKMLALPGCHTYSDEIRLADDDVNITRNDMAIDALFTQTNPARDYAFSDRETPTGILYRVYWEREDFERESEYMSALSGSIGINALTKGNPPLGVRRASFETMLPEETQKWVMDNWQKMGFKEEPYWNKRYAEMRLW